MRKGEIRKYIKRLVRRTARRTVSTMNREEGEGSAKVDRKAALNASRDLCTTCVHNKARPDWDCECCGYGIAEIADEGRICLKCDDYKEE